MAAEADRVAVGAVPIAQANLSTSFWLSPEQRAVLRSYAESARMARSTVIDDALREYFAARDIEWPRVARRV